MNLLAIPTRRLVFAILISVVLGIGWVNANPPQPATARSFWGANQLADLGACVLIFAGLLVCLRVRRPKSWLIAGGVGLVMASARFIGARYTPLDTRPYQALGAWWPLEFLIDWAVMTEFCVVALTFLRRGRRLTLDPLKRSWAWGGISALIMLAAWTPYLLIYWPGIVGRDSWSSIFMGLGLRDMRNHHPVMFSVWVGACMRLAKALGHGITAGVFVFSVSQAIIMALGLAGVCVWLRRRFGRWPGWLAVLFFAVDPSVALWSITMHKDTVFVLWMLLVTILLWEVSRRGLTWLARPLVLAGFAIGLIGISFTRNNGPYISAGLVAIIGLIAVIQACRQGLPTRRLWGIPAVGLITLGLIFAIQGPGYRRLGVIPSDRAESVGLQLHQIGWAVKYGHTTAEQRQRVSQMIPINDLKKVFTPSIVDNVKFAPEFNTQWLNDHPKEFEDLWLDLMGSNKVEYAKAWYALSGGFLDPQRTLIRMDPGTKRGSNSQVPVHDSDHLGPLLGIKNLPQKTVRAATQVASAPVIGLTYSEPLIIWLSALAALAALTRRRILGALPYLPLLGLAGTLMIASPLTDYRYVALAHFGVPIFVALWWAGPRWILRPRSRSAR